MGSNVLKSIERAHFVLNVDGKYFRLLVNIVPDNLLKYSVLLGSDFLRTVDVRFFGDKVVINSLPKNDVLTRNVIVNECGNVPDDIAENVTENDDNVCESESSYESCKESVPVCENPATASVGDVVNIFQIER